MIMITTMPTAPADTNTTRRLPVLTGVRPLSPLRSAEAGTVNSISFKLGDSVPADFFTGIL
jgi:hypothetical protein